MDRLNAQDTQPVGKQCGHIRPQLPGQLPSPAMVSFSAQALGTKMSRTSMVSAPETRGQTAGALLPLFPVLRLGLPVFELRTLEDKDSKWAPALTGVTQNLPKMEGGISAFGIWGLHTQQP